MTSIHDLVKAINKRSKLEVTVLSDDESPCIVHETMSTGCLALDSILGGGLPVGRITEIYGDESSGKSLIAAQVAAIAQDEGHIVAYIDTEGAVSIEIMREVGVDVDNLIYTVPDTLDGDDGVFQFMEDTIQESKGLFPNKLILVIWDSIAATSARREMESEYGKATYGRHAQLISQGLRKIGPYITKEGVCALFINQTREKINVHFGDKTATFGGKALSYHASARVMLMSGKKIKKGKKVVGITNRARVTKNKFAMPFREADLPIYFGEGINDALASLEYLKENKLLERRGSWYALNYKGETIANFQRIGWDKVFEEHYEAIADLILGD